MKSLEILLALVCLAGVLVKVSVKAGGPDLDKHSVKDHLQNNTDDADDEEDDQPDDLADDGEDSDYDDELAELENDPAFPELLDNLEGMAKMMKSMTKAFSSLKTTTKQLNAKLEGLESQVSGLRGQVLDRQSSVEKVKSQVAEKEKTVKRMQKQLAEKDKKDVDPGDKGEEITDSDLKQTPETSSDTNKEEALGEDSETIEVDESDSQHTSEHAQDKTEPEKKKAGRPKMSVDQVKNTLKQLKIYGIPLLDDSQIEQAIRDYEERERTGRIEERKEASMEDVLKTVDILKTLGTPAADIAHFEETVRAYYEKQKTEGKEAQENQQESEDDSSFKTSTDSVDNIKDEL